MPPKLKVVVPAFNILLSETRILSNMRLDELAKEIGIRGVDARMLRDIESGSVVVTDRLYTALCRVFPKLSAVKPNGSPVPRQEPTDPRVRSEVERCRPLIEDLKLIRLGKEGWRALDRIMILAIQGRVTEDDVAFFIRRV